MKKTSLMILGLGVLALVSCGPKDENTSKPPSTNPIRVSGVNFGGSGSVAVGEKANVMTVRFADELSSVVGSPSVTFKALNGDIETLLTAPCMLTDKSVMTCAYTVRAEDKGKAANGIQLDETSTMTGSVKAADGRTLKLNLSEISKANGISADKFTYRVGPKF